MNQVQFLQGAIGVSRPIELHTWRAQIFFSVVLAEFGGFKSMESVLSTGEKGERNSIPTELTYSLQIEKPRSKFKTPKKAKTSRGLNIECNDRFWLWLSFTFEIQTI